MNAPTPLVYIAGPFRGPTPLDVRRNVERARDVGMIVAAHGAYPVIPHTMTADFDKQLTDEFWLAGTLELMRRCDAVFLMATWTLSRGATAERAEALARDMPVFDTLAPFAQWVKHWQGYRA